MEKFIEQTNVVARMPAIDLTVPVVRYFDYVQQSVDFNPDLASRWAEIVTSLYGTVRDQADKITGIVKDQVDAVTDRTVWQARQAEDAANRQTAAEDEAARTRKGRRRPLSGPGQTGQEGGKGAVRGTDQGRTVRPACGAGAAEVRHGRGTHRDNRYDAVSVTPPPASASCYPDALGRLDSPFLDCTGSGRRVGERTTQRAP